jgi:hypothetical protein
MRNSLSCTANWGLLLSAIGFGFTLLLFVFSFVYVKSNHNGLAIVLFIAGIFVAISSFLLSFFLTQFSLAVKRVNPWDHIDNYSVAFTSMTAFMKYLSYMLTNVLFLGILLVLAILVRAISLLLS